MLHLEVQMSDGTSSLLPSLLGLSGTTELREKSPAYRATPLNHKWVGTKSPPTFPFQIVSGLTEPIPIFANFSDKKVGLRTGFSDIQKLFVVVGRCFCYLANPKTLGLSLFGWSYPMGTLIVQSGQF